MVRVFAGWFKASIRARKFRRPVCYQANPAGRGPTSIPMIEIAEIVTEAARLTSSYGLRGWMCSTLFGLIAVTGLRVNEALRLDEADVDLMEGVLTIRRTKNRKSRFVPLSPDTTERLEAYRVERNRILGADRAAFFRLENGERPTDCCARYNFARGLPAHRPAPGTAVQQTWPRSAHS